jgi:hypothetical protein
VLTDEELFRNVLEQGWQGPKGSWPDITVADWILKYPDAQAYLHHWRTLEFWGLVFDACTCFAKHWFQEPPPTLDVLCSSAEEALQISIRMKGSPWDVTVTPLISNEASLPSNGRTHPVQGIARVQEASVDHWSRQPFYTVKAEIILDKEAFAQASTKKRIRLTLHEFRHVLQSTFPPPGLPEPYVRDPLDELLPIELDARFFQEQVRFLSNADGDLGAIEVVKSPFSTKAWDFILDYLARLESAHTLPVQASEVEPEVTKLFNFLQIINPESLHGPFSFIAMNRIECLQAVIAAQQVYTRPGQSLEELRQTEQRLLHAEETAIDQGIFATLQETLHYIYNRQAKFASIGSVEEGVLLGNALAHAFLAFSCRSVNRLTKYLGEDIADYDPTDETATLLWAIHYASPDTQCIFQAIKSVLNDSAYSPNDDYRSLLAPRRGNPNAEMLLRDLLAELETTPDGLLWATQQGERMYSVAPGFLTDYSAALLRLATAWLSGLRSRIATVHDWDDWDNLDYLLRCACIANWLRHFIIHDSAKFGTHLQQLKNSTNSYHYKSQEAFEDATFTMAKSNLFQQHTSPGFKNLVEIIRSERENREAEERRRQEADQDQSPYSVQSSESTAETSDATDNTMIGELGPKTSVPPPLPTSSWMWRIKKFVKLFLLWCAGSNRDVLRHCNSEENLHIQRGGAVLLVSLVATFAMAYTVSVSTHLSYWLALPFGVFWGGAVLWLDRWIVGMVGGGRPWIRLLLAVVMSVIATDAIVLKIFEGEIDQKLLEMRRQAENLVDRSSWKQQTDDINARIKILTEEKASFTRSEQDLQDQINRELKDGNGLRRPGETTIAYILAAQLKQLRQRHESDKKSIDRDLKTLNEKKDEIEEEENKALNEVSLIATAAEGSLKRSEALVRYMSDGFWNISTRIQASLASVKVLFFFSLLLLFDCLPMVLKLTNPSKLYDEMFARYQQEERKEADYFWQVMGVVRRHRVDTMRKAELLAISRLDPEYNRVAHDAEIRKLEDLL